MGLNSISNMKFLALLALVAVVSSEFTCIKPVNRVPASLPGVCCDELDKNALLGFVYTGKSCSYANKLNETEDGSTTYSSCEDGQRAACCDPLLEKISLETNIACVLPE
ncbi:hypothetical protein N7532_011159 [Penicillium argentinense]|uniref:Hydrophobin n=1 Tax=Penicillium argentinense TaxID=1131581 RepID=A0A9W9EHX3_9EURO|nr:uncharacterized protein N7532_011159 [Penicillium argentinense]KAJ5082116.1 hypothetical protein N7532_011159 [Penicillium argentinense]